MQIEVNEKEYCKLSVSYKEDSDVVSSKREEVVSKFKGAKVNGFRPGRVPLDVIKLNYKKQINEQLKSELLQNAYENVIFEKKIKAYGMPLFTSSKLDSFSFSCDFELYKAPEFDLQDYKNLEVVKPAQIISEQDLVQKSLQELRLKFAEQVPFTDTDTVQDTDSIIVNIKTTDSDGNEISELTSEGQLLTVGRTNLKGFDECLMGMKVDEERSFTVHIPESDQPHISNKDLIFSVKILMGSKQNPLPLNDDLALKVGFKDLNALMENLNSMASSKAQSLDQKSLYDAVIKQLVAVHDIKVPDWLILPEAKILAQQSGQTWDSTPDDSKEQFLKMATQNIKLSLILDKVRDDAPDAQLSFDEAFNVLRSVIRQDGAKPAEELKQIERLKESGQLQIIINRIKDEHTIDFLSKNIKVIEG